MEEGARHSVPPDGFLRLTLDALLSVRMVHLLSAVDSDESPGARRCGVATFISGYTEWGSEGLQVPVSLGWDWSIDLPLGGELTYQRIGMPRSNVMLIDSQQQDFGWTRNLQALALMVDSLPWADQTRRAVQFS